MEPFRVDPQLPVGAMKTYSVLQPLATHWRDATCEEAGCPNWRDGWRTVVDTSTDLGRRQADYIRRSGGRRFVEAQCWGASEMIEFTFEAGQRCFAAHRVPLERDPLLLVRMGDWRGYGPTRVHQRPGDWIDDMQTTLDRVRTRQERG